MILKQAKLAGFLLTCALGVLFITSGVSFADDGGIGMVIALEGSASALRNGADVALALKDRVFVSDAITTSAGAKIQILLDDDSAITIAQNSTVLISDFLDGGSDSKFGAHVAEGRARIVTGRITENNPKGFNVTTKHAAIGIRGTILTITATEDETRVDVENTDKVVVVNGTDVPEFYRAVIRGDAFEMIPLSPEDRENDALFSSSGGPSASNDGGESERADTSLQVGGGLAEQTASDMKMKIPSDEPVVPMYASASGVLNSPSSFLYYSSNQNTTTFTGTFGFDLDLQTGAISGANINAILGFEYFNREHVLGVNLYDGTGTANANGFSAQGFGGTLTVSHLSSTNTYTDNGSSIQGGANLTALEHGSDFDVNYHLGGIDDSSYFLEIDGDGTGTIEHK